MDYIHTSNDLLKDILSSNEAYSPTSFFVATAAIIALTVVLVVSTIREEDMVIGFKAFLISLFTIGFTLAMVFNMGFAFLDYRTSVNEHNASLKYNIDVDSFENSQVGPMGPELNGKIYDSEEKSVKDITIIFENDEPFILTTDFVSEEYIKTLEK